MSIVLDSVLVFDNVKKMLVCALDKISGDEVESLLRRQSSLPKYFQTDLHMVIHAIQDISYHSGQLSYIIGGNTLR